MKRLICTLLGAVALIPLAAGAQMRGGGMRGGMGGHAPGGSVRSGGGMGARAPGGSVRSGPGFAPRVAPAFVARPTGARVFAPSGRVRFTTNHFNRFHHFRHRFGFFSNCFGSFPCDNRFGFGDPFFGASFGGFGYPYYSSFPSDYYPPAPPATVSSDNSGEVELAREVQRLSDQIEDLRYEEGRRANAERPAAPSSHSSLSAQTPAASTTFVLRDGHRIVAQNYAIAGQSLWIVDEHRARKIVLADVDPAATEQVNAENGVDFRLP